MQAMIDELTKQAAESLGQVSSKETLAFSISRPISTPVSTVANRPT